MLISIGRTDPTKTRTKVNNIYTSHTFNCVGVYLNIFSGTVDGETSTDDCENSGDYQIVTEIWVEPQCGYVQTSIQRGAGFMNHLQYHQLPDAVSKFPLNSKYQDDPFSSKIIEHFKTSKLIL